MPAYMAGGHGRNALNTLYLVLVCSTSQARPSLAFL